MQIFNLGIPEIILIMIVALIVMGPGNMVKSARDIGAFIRKVTQSPYWKEVWATRRELNELPKILAKEADLDGTINELNKETSNLHSSLTSTMTSLIKEVEEPVKKVEQDLKAIPPVTVSIPAPDDESDQPSVTTDTEIAQPVFPVTTSAAHQGKPES